MFLLYSKQNINIGKAQVSIKQAGSILLGGKLQGGVETEIRFSDAPLAACEYYYLGHINNRLPDKN